MASFYTAYPWYWIVAGSTTQVWSSQSFSFVAVTNATYVAWKLKNTASRIGSAGELLAVMLAQVQPIIFASGVAVTSTGTSAINATYAITPAAFQKLALITSLIGNAKGLPGGAGTFVYPDITNTNHTFTPTLILNLATALQTYVYAWEVALTTKVGGGAASFPTVPLVIA